MRRCDLPHRLITGGIVIVNSHTITIRRKPPSPPASSPSSVLMLTMDMPITLVMVIAFALHSDWPWRKPSDHTANPLNHARLCHAGPLSSTKHHSEDNHVNNQGSTRRTRGAATHTVTKKPKRPTQVGTRCPPFFCKRLPGRRFALPISPSDAARGLQGKEPLIPFNRQAKSHHNPILSPPLLLRPVGARTKGPTLHWQEREGGA